MTTSREPATGRRNSSSVASDTSAEMERLLAEGYRQMTPAQKWHLICEQSAADDEHALAGIRRRHPGADEREVRLRLAALKYGDDVAAAALGWNPPAGDP